jgi:hypothetical protein
LPALFADLFSAFGAATAQNTPAASGFHALEKSVSSFSF